ncbi:MAG TPA: hypothetical protein VFZ53_32220 [Polyangiaceae bacterium]
MKRFGPFAVSLLAALSPGTLAAGASDPGGGAGAPLDASGAAAPAAGDEPLETRVSGYVSVALGMPRLDFVNELAGARFELGYTRRFSLGLALAYANLKGKDGRASNVLPEGSVAYRVAFADDRFAVPIRFSAGYLPMNGPTLRLGAGFDFMPSDAVAFELTLLEPMVWVTRDRPELSLNVGGAVRAVF